jgi:hypothetical protein
LSVFNKYIHGGYQETGRVWLAEKCTTDDGPTDAIGDVFFLGFEKTAKVVKTKTHKFS